VTRFACIGFGETGGRIAERLHCCGGKVRAAFDSRANDPELGQKHGV